MSIIDSIVKGSEKASAGVAHASEKASEKAAHASEKASAKTVGAVEKTIEKGSKKLAGPPKNRVKSGPKR